MTIEDLRKYEKWHYKSAFEILQAVNARGGWTNVFQPGKFPAWAHRLRNWFNVTPKKLQRVDTDVAEQLMKGAKRFDLAADCMKALRAKRAPSLSGAVAYAGALSGDVYLDENNRGWFQMSVGGSIYHYGDPVKFATAESVWATYKGQDECPIFKLVSPDGTGGSSECVITNPKHVRKSEKKKVIHGDISPARRTQTLLTRDERIGELYEFIEVETRHVNEPKWRGSYNYGDTYRPGMPSTRNSTSPRTTSWETIATSNRPQTPVCTHAFFCRYTDDRRLFLLHRSSFLLHRFF